MWWFRCYSPLAVPECADALRTIRYPRDMWLDKGRGYEVTVIGERDLALFEVIAYGAYGERQDYALVMGTITADDNGYTRVTGRVRLMKTYRMVALLLFVFFPLLGLSYGEGYYLATFLLWLSVAAFVVWGVWDTSRLMKRVIRQAVMAVDLL
ncbi:MAG: hypothetical protein AAF653_17440 [Chloroflexota bacterium]